ncbi:MULTISPECIES: hypothetical protein [Acetobacterales]|nr:MULTISPECIES: hypothetical protein [Rhodospirillales]GIX10653.1 MAG: hypothetical protein KatS3mg116_2363 [Elioraea sp.]GIX10710.1 MAG: hypothetical protein KatS3mg116_2420 [Elioraea sp.]
MTNRTILPTENTEWGFWGTMGEHAAAAWPIAFAAIRDATNADPDAVRAFLDSRHGRHFADEVSNHLHAGTGLADAITRATATWMGWRIDRRTARETGIPAGLPYLTGFVIHEGIAAEDARD